MAMKAQKITSEEIHGIIMAGIDHRICEMMSDNQLINVPVDPRIDIDTITSDDPDPKFVNVEVLRAGTSGNRRRYSNNIVKEVNEMIPGCQGFFGHPDPSKYGFEFREPQCIFVGSTIEHMPDGIDRAIAKAYLFKSSPLREWIPKSIAAGNPMTVSVNGTGDVMKNGDILDVVHMRDLQSIDWANPGTEGMETSQAMSVVREMQDNNNNQGGNEKMAELNAQDIISNVTVTEFKAFNPNGYDSVVKGITVTELKAINPALVQQIEESAKITELALKLDGKDEMVKITEMQNKIDAFEQKISALEGEATKSKLDAYKVAKVTEMVDDAHRDAIMKRVTGTTEKEIDESLNSEIAYVREMGGLTGIVGGAQQKTDGSDITVDSMKSLFGVKEDK